MDLELYHLLGFLSKICIDGIRRIKQSKTITNDIVSHWSWRHQLLNNGIANYTYLQCQGRRLRRSAPAFQTYPSHC